MNIRFTFNELIIKLIILFPITTTVQGLPGMENINKTVIVFMVALFAVSFFTKAIKLRNIMYIILVMILFIASCDSD